MVKRDPETNKNNIKICPRCKGNGFIKYRINRLKNLVNLLQCRARCVNQQGELDDPNDTIIIDADGIHRLAVSLHY